MSFLLLNLGIISGFPRLQPWTVGTGPVTLSNIWWPTACSTPTSVKDDVANIRVRLTTVVLKFISLCFAPLGPVLQKLLLPLRAPLSAQLFRP